MYKMTMKTRFMMMMAAAAMVLAACSNDEESDNWNGEIRLSSGLAVQQVTRAATGIQSDQFASGENIDVFINEATTTGQESTTVTTYDQPLVYTAGGSGTMTPPDNKQPYFPTSGNGVNIYAVYPTNTASTWNGTTFTVANDQSADASYKASDLMYGQPANNPVNRTSSATVLTFKHLLSKVTITLESGNGTPNLDGSIVKLKNVKPSTTLTPSTGGISEATGNGTDITVKESSNSALSGSAVVVPQTLATSFIEVTLANGGVLTSKGLVDGNNLPIEEVNLTSGNEYKYTITVNLTSLNVTSTITPWDGTEVTGEATMGN